MEDTKAFTPTSATMEVIDLPALSSVRQMPGHLADVPQDIAVDYLAHLNDPNWDFEEYSVSSPSSTAHDSIELGSKLNDAPARLQGKGSDIDSESQTYSRYSSSRSEVTAAQPDEIEYPDSPYVEVRAAVSSIDDPTIPTNTFRVWFVGIVLTVLISELNQMLSLRYPSVLITGIVATLIAFPFGQFLARVLPTARITVCYMSFTLNPGPCTVKETTLMASFASVVINGAYATDVLLTQQVFYNQKVTFAYQMMLILSTQLLGFGLAGAIRRWVVWPASMMWPGALVQAALLRTLHTHELEMGSKISRFFGKTDGRGHISHTKFFYIATGCSFIWYWVPGYLFTGLSMFNWACWIAPNNVVVNQLFGSSTGLGMGLLTFDWSIISYVGSPLVTPWWSEANTAAAFVVFFWILTPILYYTKTFHFDVLPISAFVSFDNTGFPYNATAIVTNGIFDVARYQEYSPLFMSATLAVSYGISFASFTALLVHVALWHGKDIVHRFRTKLSDERDIHSKMMLSYDEVPTWWYIALFSGSVFLAVVTIEVFPIGLPVWALLLAVGLAALFALPLAIIMAISNQIVSMQILHQMIIGYLLPNAPVANMVFKTVSYIGHNQAVTFAGNLKLGHYMKIPPKMMFSVQVVAALISCFVSNLVQNFMMEHVVDLCSPDQAQGFTCPSTNSFATASLVWGAIGPQRLYSAGTLYNPFLWFFVVGGVAPVPFYFLARRYPKSVFRLVNMPVFFAGTGAFPPASALSYSSFAIVCFTFNYWIRRFHFRWWMRYNYSLSAALDAGVVIGMVAVFLMLQLPKGGIELNWIGTRIWQDTADFNGMPLTLLNEGVTFGPSSWL